MSYMGRNRNEGVGKWSSTKRGRRIRRSLWGNGYYTQREINKSVNRHRRRSKLRRLKKVRRVLTDLLTFSVFIVILYGLCLLAK